MNPHQRISNRFFLLGLGFICLIVYTLLLAAIAYIRGQVMNPYIFPIAIAMTGITQFFAAKALFPDKPWKLFFQGLLILLAVTGISIWAAGEVYDLSSEGQWVHQETIRRLKTGWNPYVKTLEAPEIEIAPDGKNMSCSGPDPVSDSGLVTIPDPKYDLINYQPKGPEIVESAIYSLTGRLETGKAVNLLAVFGAFSLCLAWLYGQPGISVAKKWALALIAAGNPVILAQLPGFRTEGTLAAFGLALLVCCLMINESVAQYRVYLFGLLLIFCLNVRQAGWIFPTAITAGFLLFLLLKKDRLKMKKIFYAALLSAAIGVIFIGFHPYVSNFISGENAGSETIHPNITRLSDPTRPDPTGYAFPLWWLPVAGLLMLERWRTNVSRWLRGLLYGVLTLNLAWATWGFIISLLLSARAGYQLQQMKELNEPLLVEFCARRGFQSNEWRLRENDIPYNLGKLSGGHIENIILSTTRFETEKPLPVLPKTFLVRWAETFPASLPE